MKICTSCNRPVWDGGHALNAAECAANSTGGGYDQACQLATQLTAATARAEKAERELDYARGEIQRMTGCRPDDVLAADRAYREKLDEMQAQRDALRAENERLAARVGVLRGVLASWMGHAMHSQEERKQAEAVLAEADGKQ